MLYSHGGKTVRRFAHKSGAAPFRGGLPQFGRCSDQCDQVLQTGQFTDPEAHRMAEEFIARGQEDSPSKIVSSHALSSGRP